MQGRLIVVLFFVLFFITGAVIFKDYGISWDEIPQRLAAVAAFKAAVANGQGFSLQHLSFSMFLVSLERIFSMEDPKTIFLTRHFCNFLIFFAAVCFFYLHCLAIFGRRWIALAGCLFLVLSPRIFAHSFYNPKDIPILALSIIGLFCLKRFLDSDKMYYVPAQAIICVLLYMISAVGLQLIAVTCLGGALEIVKRALEKKRIKGCLLTMAIYAGIITILIILGGPGKITVGSLSEIYHSFENSVGIDYKDPVLFFGRWYQQDTLPWFYTPAWIAVSTPVSYIILFLIGSGAAVRAFVTKPLSVCYDRRDDLLYFFWVFVPLIVPVMFKMPLYDSWRHHYFIYPAVIIFALKGLVSCAGYIKAKLNGQIKKYVIYAGLSFMALDLYTVASFMIRNHPYEDVYFNQLVGGAKGAVGRFELDYWGLSCRKGLEYVLDTDKADFVMLGVDSYPGRTNCYILDPGQIKRIGIYNYPHLQKDLVLSPDGKLRKVKLKYLLTHFRWGIQPYPFPEYYSIYVDGAKILAIYELPPEE